MKQIPLYPSYSVSEDGLTVRNDVTGRILKQGVQVMKGKETGYMYVTLLLPMPLRIPVHRLVCMTYNGQPTGERNHVNHIDGNKSNNHASNLEWVTHSENILKSYRTGQRVAPTGENHWLTGTKASKETRRIMSEQKKGIKHPKFSGYYIIDNVRYPSSHEAERQTGINYKTIHRRCKQKPNKWLNYHFEPLNRLI